MGERDALGKAAYEAGRAWHHKDWPDAPEDIREAYMQIAEAVARAVMGQLANFHDVIEAKKQLDAAREQGRREGMNEAAFMLTGLAKIQVDDPAHNALFAAAEEIRDRAAKGGGT